MGAQGGRGIGGSTVSGETLYNAFLQALTDAPSNGGGGSSVLVPDFVVTGSGVGAYVIPAGFNAIVNVTQGFSTFNVNGSPIIETSGREDDVNQSVGGSGHVNNISIFTSKNQFPMKVSGTVELFGQGPGFQAGGQVFVGSTLIGTLASHPTASGVSFSYANLTLNFNQSIRTSSVVTWFAAPSPLPTFVNNGVGITAPISSASMKMELPTGTTISGGRYVVELFAI